MPTRPPQRNPRGTSEADPRKFLLGAGSSSHNRHAGATPSPEEPQRNPRGPRAAVTGVFSYSGSFIAEELLARGWDVVALGRTPGSPGDPLAGRVTFRRLELDDAQALERSLSGCSLLVNTYWIRFEHGSATFGEAVARSSRLFDAARSAGVERIVHLSVSNPAADSPFPYFRGKAAVEAALRRCGPSYAILRPTLVFGGRQEILVNNIAWLLRRLPVFLLPDGGRGRVQPVAVADLASAAAELAAERANVVHDLAGPEIFTFAGLAAAIRSAVGSRARLASAPAGLVRLGCAAAGLILRDTLLTRDELDALAADLLVCARPTASTRFSDWLPQNAAWLGRRYANELARNWRVRG